MVEKGKRNPFKSQREKAQDKSKLVGAYLPLPSANCLRLLSVYFGKSIQGILKEIIMQWVNTVEKTEKEIMDILIERAVFEWQRRVIESGNMSKKEQEQYMCEIERNLRRKKITKSHLEYIINKLKSKVGCIE